MSIFATEIVLLLNTGAKLIKIFQILLITIIIYIIFNIIMSTLTERAKEIAKYKKMSMVRFQESLGLSISHFYNTKYLTRKVARAIEQTYPEINIDWLASGNGNMLNEGVLPKMASNVNSYYIPVLPIASQGNSSDTFEQQVAKHTCEMILSPIESVDIALAVTGDSMSPEYPNGSKVLLQKIDEQTFIEWGHTYVLDTVNGPILKDIYPSKDNQAEVVCRSVNPNFADFSVSSKDIKGWYRVRCCIAIK